VLYSEFVVPIQRPSFATASDDWWQSQVLQRGNYSCVITG